LHGELRNRFTSKKKSKGCVKSCFNMFEVPKHDVLVGGWYVL